MTPPKVSKTDSPPLSPSTIQSPNTNATVHALIASLSPIKPSRYFDGELTDGDSVIRVVGFDKHHREKLHSFSDENVPITLKNCQIQLNRFKNKLEIVLKSTTTIERSPVHFEVTDFKTVGSPLIPLSDLEKMEEYDRVTVRAKVIKVNEPQPVGTGKLKQDVIIADATAKSSVTLWESNVNVMQPQNSYQLNRVLVRIFMGKHHLSIPTAGSTIEEISDVENTAIDTDGSEDEEEILESVTIVGVQNLQTVFMCMNCKKHVTPTGEHTGSCDSCNTMQMLCNTKMSAKLFVRPQGTQIPISLKVYGEMLKQIVPKEKITSNNLLFAPHFDLT